MYSSENENDLIVTDVVQVMLDAVGLQQDINEVKCKNSWLIAQEVDMERILDKSTFDRCRTPLTEQDNKLRRLVLKALSFYAYARLLKGNQGVFTDGGYTVEKEATNINATNSVYNYHYSLGDVYMTKIIDFLKLENPQLDNTKLKTKLVPRIRKVGGREHRGSN